MVNMCPICLVDHVPGVRADLRVHAPSELPRLPLSLPLWPGVLPSTGSALLKSLFVLEVPTLPGMT